MAEEQPRVGYVVRIGKILDLWFDRLEDAQEFAAGFNYARRQRDKIHYEFKSKYRTRGFRFANQIRDWLEKIEEFHLWLNTRAALTNGNADGSLPSSPPSRAPRRQRKAHGRDDGSPPVSG